MSLTRRRHHHVIRRSNSSLKWFLIITIVIVIIGAFLGLKGGLINFIDEHADVLDTQYIPKDLDRTALDALKGQMKDIDKNKMEELKKKYLDKIKQ